MVWSKSAGSQHAVDMGMVLQTLIPGVEHAEETDLRAKMPGIASDLQGESQRWPETGGYKSVACSGEQAKQTRVAA